MTSRGQVQTNVSSLESLGLPDTTRVHSHSRILCRKLPPRRHGQNSHGWRVWTSLRATMSVPRWYRGAAGDLLHCSPGPEPSPPPTPSFRWNNNLKLLEQVSKSIWVRALPWQRAEVCCWDWGVGGEGKGQGSPSHLNTEKRCRAWFPRVVGNVLINSSSWKARSHLQWLEQFYPNKNFLQATLLSSLPPLQAPGNNWHSFLI